MFAFDTMLNDLCGYAERREAGRGEKLKRNDLYRKVRDGMVVAV